MLHLVLSTVLMAFANDKPFHTSELIFPPEQLHNHASCIVECPNGDLLVCWYNGSGERSADDVKIEGSRKYRGAPTWSPRFLLADTPGFPDTNPCMFIDPQKRLWLLWQTLVANEWHTALPKYKISRNFTSPGAPVWDHSDTMLLKPGPEFLAGVKDFIAEEEKTLAARPDAEKKRLTAWMDNWKRDAASKYFSRMGWMTRAHPFVLHGERLIVPLYSDGYSFSIMAITDDWGQTWKASKPLVSLGGIQPSIVKKRNGTLVTYMRDNGPPPKRMLMSSSSDGGMSWTPVKDSTLPNPGAGTEVVGLANGHWVMIYNDTERGRHSLALSVSDDEGKTWKWTRHLEKHEPGANEARGHYPSIIQGADGTLHVTYTYTLNGDKIQRDAQGRPMRECIKYAHCNEAWILQGD